MPSFLYEDKTNLLTAGLDEAGRGPWVGPVVAGAVIFLKRNVDTYLLEHLNDSKKLSSPMREKLFELIKEEAKKGNMCYGIGSASAAEIDELNILQATFLAMRRAVLNLPLKPDFALIDGNKTPNLDIEQRAIIKGDSKSANISAASIIAKVSRDRYMLEMAEKYPEYQFEKHKGYGTKLHYEMIEKYGVSPIHRITFLKKFLGNE